MSLNVGLTFRGYQERSLSTCAPAWPPAAYHSTVSVPTNHAIGCARSTLRALHTLGSCSPRYCLLSKNASSILHLLQYPWIRNAAETLGSVATSVSSRHWPSGSRTSTTITGLSPQPVYHNTSRTTWTRRRRASLGNWIVRNRAGYVAVSSIIASGVGSRFPFLGGRPWPPYGPGRSYSAASHRNGPSTWRFAGRPFSNSELMYAASPTSPNVRSGRCSARWRARAAASRVRLLEPGCPFLREHRQSTGRQE